jgi:hypothetical protein
MKLRFFVVLFPLFALFFGCSNYENIIRKNYQYEKYLLKKYNIIFNIHLENIRYSKKTGNLIEKLVYKNKNFDEYVSYIEDNLAETINSNDFLPAAGEDKIEFDNQLYFSENINILHNFDSFLVIEHKKYLIFPSEPHGTLWTEYLIVDLAGERILDIDDIAVPLSEDFLEDIIHESYKVNNFLRDEIWPPDSINIEQDFIELTWNVYSIAPYSDGMISVVLQHDLFLTKKGKAIKAKICGNDVDNIFDGKRLIIKL